MTRSLLLLGTAFLGMCPVSAAGESPGAGAALEALASGTDPLPVALAAGCEDVAALEAWLFPATGEFETVEAGFPGGGLAPGGPLRSPLAAERQGLRARNLYFASFLPPSVVPIAHMLDGDEPWRGSGSGTWALPGGELSAFAAFDRLRDCRGFLAHHDPRCGYLQPVVASGRESRTQRTTARPPSAQSRPPSPRPAATLPVREPRGSEGNVRFR